MMMYQGKKFFQKDEEDLQGEQETQPASKSFQNNDSRQKEEQKSAKRNFFTKNDDEPSDPEYDDSEKGPADQPKKIKFFSKNDESTEKEQDTQKKSKFFGGSDDEDEEQEVKPVKSKFFAVEDDSEEEETAKKSKFFAVGEDEESGQDADDEAQATSKNGEVKADKERKGNKRKKKGKGKQKDKSESEDDNQKVEQTELKKDRHNKEADPEKDKDDINIDEIDFDGPKKKSRNQKKKEKLKAKKEGVGKEAAKAEELGEKASETKPTEAKEKIEFSKPKLEEKKRKADEIKVKIEETKPVDSNVKPEETKTEKADAKKDEGKKDNKKGKKQSAVALKIQEMQEKKRKREDEEKKRVEEIQRQIREQQEKEEAEERIRKEEQEKRRKEREAKKQKMIEEGTYKTKKDRKREIFVQQAREQFLQSGMVRAVAEEGGEKKDSKVVSNRKKKPPQKKPDDPASTQIATTDDDTEAKVEGDNHPEPQITATTQETKDTAQEQQQQPAEDDFEDDWMKLADDKKESEVKADEKKDTQTAQPEEQISKKDDKTKKPKDEKTIPSNAAEPPSTSKKSKDQRNKKPKADTTEEESKDEPILRSPICCVMGHVDTGKTKLLDKMRNTNVQKGEAGGITQQIGATFFPREKLETEVVKITDHYNMKLNVPGLLVIDTPGHETFSNLRSRGSGLCDIVILVIDIMHGVQRQTLEAIELVKMRKTPYVIALNKIDRLYGWKATQGASSYVSLMKQNRDVRWEFEGRVKKIITSLNENSLNVALYYDNPNVDEYASIIPTSAITGEDIPDLLGVVIRLTQRWLRKKIQLKDEFKCSVLEVKVIEGLGPTIDCLLVNGSLREGDTIALNTFKGPISTSIRALLTPHPMKEMRVKGEYIHHKEIKIAMGIKICADNLREAIAGSDMYLVKKDSELQSYMDIFKEEINEIENKINTTSEGVSVAASTLGSLEALLQLLKKSEIPVSNIFIGPVSKEKVVRAMIPLLTQDRKVKKEYATILAFDVKVLPDAQAYADNFGVKIMTANILYHLLDQFTAYLKEIKEKRRLEEGKDAVFPCIIQPVVFFKKKNPITMCIDVVEGALKVGTPLVLYNDKEKIKIGVVELIESKNKSIQQARPTDGSVTIRLSGDPSITCGRHFELKDQLASLLSKKSVYALAEHFRDVMYASDWDLVSKLKKFFGIL